jgi:hypothetical protein
MRKATRVAKKKVAFFGKVECLWIFNLSMIFSQKAPSCQIAIPASV